MKHAVTVLLVLLASCSGGSPASGGGSSTDFVRAAYLDAWAVRDDAVHRADPGLIARRFADVDPSAFVEGLPAGTRSAFSIVSESVAARIDAGLDIKGEIGHDIGSVDLTNDSTAAQVVDRITDRTFLVDRTTGLQKSSDESTTRVEIWFLALRSGTWKVVYFLRRS